MPVIIEALRSLNQWVKVENLGPEPYEIKSNISYAGIRYIIGQDEDGIGAVLTTMSPAKDDLAKKLSGAFRGLLVDLKIEPLERGRAVFIEGVLPGNTKSETLRLTQE